MSVDAFNDWSLSVTVLGAAILWQSALLAGLAAVVCRLLRRSAPALRYWCWQVVALKLLLMPWWAVAISLPGFPGEGASGVAPPAAQAAEYHESDFGAAMDSPAALSAGEAEAATDEPPGRFDFLGRLTWRSRLVLAWLGGIAWQVGCVLVQRRRLGRLLRRATAAEPRLLAVVDQVVAQLGLSRRPAVALTDGGGSPFVCGLFRPVLVLPRRLLDELDADQWRAVVLHELGHLKRLDLWWGWLPALARIVYFFHPVVHWVCFRIRLEQELACDQLAMAHSGRGAADYAEVLVQVVTHASMPAAFTMTSLEGLSTFWKRRLTMLPSTSRSSPRLSRLTGLAVVSAAIAACVLPTFQPASAQAQPQHARPGAKAKGRIYVSAALRFKAEGQDEEKTHYGMLIAIDPATGKWQKMADGADYGRVSPDGQTLVFGRHDEGIWNCDTGGSKNPGRISDKSGRPIWSPDGKHLVATKQENLDKDNEKDRKTPAWRDETWRIDADGSNPVQLPIPDTDSVEDWSPDGQ
ncbi:MAG: M56 family metallopeptidase, partial [Geminicoccaceae bacterium]